MNLPTKKQVSNARIARQSRSKLLSQNTKQQFDIQFTFTCAHVQSIPAQKKQTGISNSNSDRLRGESKFRPLKTGVQRVKMKYHSHKDDGFMQKDVFQAPHMYTC